MEIKGGYARSAKCFVPDCEEYASESFVFDFMGSAHVLKKRIERLPEELTERAIALALFGIALSLDSELRELKLIAIKAEQRMARLEEALCEEDREARWAFGAQGSRPDAG